MKERLCSTGWWCVVVVLVCLASIHTYAADDDAQLDVFGDFGDLDLSALLNVQIRSASAKVETISDAPAVIEVFTARQLRAWGVSNLYEALPFIPGIEVVENTVGFENVIIRGLVPQFTNNLILFLVDGIPIYEVGAMHVFLEQIPINTIDKVEVIRGPGAVLYGTNAYAGVIHVFTKSLDTPELNIRGQAGFPTTYDLRSDGGWAWDDGYARLSVQAHSTPKYTGRLAGDIHGQTGTFQRQETTVTSLLQAEHTMDDLTFWLRGNHFWQEDLKCCIAPIVSARNLPNSVHAGFISTGLRWRGDHWRAGGEIGYAKTRQSWQLGPFSVLDPAAAALPPLQLNQTARLDADTIRFQTEAGLERDHYSIVFGLGHALHTAREVRLLLDEPGMPEADSPAQNPVQPGKSVNETNLFFQADYAPIKALKFVAGARYSLFVVERARPGTPSPSAKNTISPRAGIIAHASERYTVKALYGRGFRLPSLNELYQEAPIGGSQGDPNLKPETIDTVELALDARPVNELSVRLSAFYNFTRDNIDFVRQDAFNQQLENVPGVSVRGLELSIRWLPHRLVDTGLSAGFQESFGKNTATGNYDLYNNKIARVTGSFWTTLSVWPDKLDLTPQLQYISSRAGYNDILFLHATAFYDVLDWIALGIIGKNLTDTRPRQPEHLDYPITDGVIQNEPLTIQFLAEFRF